MNWLDILLCALAALFIYQGFRQGFTRLVIGLIATLLGLVLASWFYGVAGAFLIPYVSSRSIANIAGFLIVFVFVQLTGALLALLLSRIFKWSGLSWVDRGLGAVFGLLKATLVGIILIMAITAFPIRPIPTSVAESRIAPYLIEASHLLVYLCPNELKTGFLDTYDRIKKLWQGLPGPGEAKQPPHQHA